MHDAGATSLSLASFSAKVINILVCLFLSIVIDLFPSFKNACVLYDIIFIMSDLFLQPDIYELHSHC